MKDISNYLKALKATLSMKEPSLCTKVNTHIPPRACKCASNVFNPKTPTSALAYFLLQFIKIKFQNFIFFVYIYNHLALQIMLKQLILKSPPICLGWVCKKTVYICVCIYWLSLYSCHHQDYHEKSSENIIRCWKTLTWMNAKLYIQKGGAMCFWVLKTSKKNPPTCYVQ